MKKSNFSSIESIIKTVKKNGMFILVDDESKHEEMENEGDLVISTSAVNPNYINFMAKHARGLICLAMDNIQSKKIGLTLASPINQSRSKTAFTYSIEAKKGVTTGISAYDRAKTIKVASNKNAKKNDIVSPGHIFPVIAEMEVFLFVQATQRLQLIFQNLQKRIIPLLFVRSWQMMEKWLQEKHYLILQKNINLK